MAANCIHGFAPGTCLICQTLERPSAATKAGPAPETKTATRASKPDAPASSTRSRSLVKRGSAGPRVVPDEAPRTGSPTIVKLVGLAVAVVAIIVVAWTVLHLVFAVLHILELVGVAAIFSYIGWVLGVHHGHRTARRE